jgi:hypothetical protein
MLYAFNTLILSTSEQFKVVKEANTVYQGMIGVIAGKHSSKIWVAPHRLSQRLISPEYGTWSLLLEAWD